MKDIAAKASAFQFNTRVPLKHWLRTADTLLKEVSHEETSLGNVLTFFVHRRTSTNEKIMPSKHFSY